MRPPSIHVRFGILVLAGSLPPAPALAQWTFTDVSASAFAGSPHVVQGVGTNPQQMVGGAACGDFDGDGWIDLYHLGGNLGRNHLLRNNADGTFSDVAVAAGVDLAGTWGAGAAFADWNGDGFPDLFVGAVAPSTLSMFENNGDGTFRDVTGLNGVPTAGDAFSASFGDLDGDHDLDLVIARWGQPRGPTHFWRNDGTVAGVTQFVSADTAWGYVDYRGGANDWTFAYNLADLNGDGWTDVACASDFVTSHVYRNDGGTLVDATDTAVIDDDNGMGSYLADYDKDGDLDWFVTSILNTVTGAKDGNRMYRNLGDGTFEDATDHAGVRDGQWGWGATMQDLDNDGWIDIYHVNGWPNPSQPFVMDPARLFHSNRDGTFTEIAAAMGVDHPGQGRGVCALDYDRDGDQDLFLANWSSPAVLYRNDGGNANHWLQVRLVGPFPNTEQIGAKVTATAGSSEQMWQVRGGNNFLSQDPVEIHFGLAGAASVQRLEVVWSNGAVTMLNDVPADQRLVLYHPLLDQTVSAPAVSGPEPLPARPNPFRSGTTFAFRLSRPASAVLVHDLAGRRVRTLAEGRLTAGENRVDWDGRDDSGRPAAAGVYAWTVRGSDERIGGRVVRVR